VGVDVQALRDGAPQLSRHFCLLKAGATGFMGDVLARRWVVLKIGRNYDPGSREVSRCMHFEIGFDLEFILTLKIAETTIVGLEKTHDRPEA
jgi:hypothetical protein